MTSRALREAFHREYLTFFERAERTRRWNVFDDIPWDELDNSPKHDRLALGAEMFCGVEMFLPDYLQANLSLMRGDYGRAWFAVNWGYEEAKHSLALWEYLRRSGQRTESQLHDYADSVLARQWRAPYESARQMSVYAAVQELTTFVSYRMQRELAVRAGDRVLAETYRLIARDEMAHSRFYRRMLALHLDDDRTGTLADLALVVRTFRMPAHDLLPDYARREDAMRVAGVDRGVFFTEVVLPLLGSLGLTRQDVYAVPLPPGARSAAAPPEGVR